MPNALCPVCKVGKIAPAGPPFTDSGAVAGGLKELKVLMRCTECGYSEERNAEPLNIDKADHGEAEE